MTLNTFDWAKLESSRRSWAPSNPAANSELSAAPNTISRCLALTSLEPAVAGFIRDGLDRYDNSRLGDDCINALLKNIEDEDKHERSLLQCKAAMSNYSAACEKEALDITSRWSSLSDNPITIAAVLECGVFFIVLPLYSQFGGSSLRISSASISGDERGHVQSHRQAAKLLGDRPSKALNQLRLDTVEWLSKDLETEAGSKWTLDRMIKNSNSLMQRGVSDLLETRVANVNANYEISNSNMEDYK